MIARTRPAQPPAPSLADDAAERVRAGWAALAATIAVAVVHLAPASGLAPGALDGDLGIQFFLGGETARGAVPLVDFEHTWNVGSWWFNAVLHRVADGDPSVWLYLWGRVFGPALAAVTAVGVLWRARVRAEWILVGAGSWLALSHVIHSKYTIPVLWAFVLLPTRTPSASASSLRRDVLARALVAGLTMLSQVELAVLLGAGVVLFDLVGPTEDVGQHAWRRRVVRAAAVPAGALVALGLELAAYSAIGQPPGEILRQLLANPTETAEGFNYGYPLFTAPSLRPKLLPASLAVAFIPAIWLRLAPGTRLVACLHLTQALIAIRRPDPAHVDAATTLLGLLVVLLAHDLVLDPRGRGPLSAALRQLRDGGGRGGGRGPTTGGAVVLAAVTGAAVMVLVLAAAFRTESLFALAMPTVLLGGMALVADRSARTPSEPWLTGGSAGALVVVVALLIASVAGGVRASLRDGDALAPVESLAAQLADPLDRCAGPDRQAWVVPGPLALYTELGATNPTPYTVFWYGFQAEQDRVRTAIRAGAIPAIIQVGDGWPTSFGTLPDDIADAFSQCAVVERTPTTPSATVWVAD